MKKQRACNHEEGLPKRAWGITREKVEEDDQQGMTEQASMGPRDRPVLETSSGASMVV